MIDYEALGQFYLGKRYDPDTRRTTDELLLYDARDLTTHGVCVGMTGSGKTGLCLSLLEEAALDGIPVLAIDPKGDLGNLLLTFPDLRPDDFRPWIDEAEAARAGRTPAEHAAHVAAQWKQGLADWNQPPERIARFRNAAELTIYTPGGTAGRPLMVLKSLAAPPPEVLDDPELLRERCASLVSGLLALIGLEADPVQSREHILLSNLLSHSWRDGRDLDLAQLITGIQQPPFEKLGVIDLEAFYPARDRFQLALTLNNLLASPGFGAWIVGEPLDVQKLLFTADGRPRISILNISHLNDAERMFFVTVLLNETVAWMRRQAGTGSLRALLYMDEVFGYLPPTANPPSKTPLLTLLKQARAFGLGILLATQNPVDLDYKALSNAGTWLIGRLQTERDKLRLLDGLESVGAKVDRATLDRIISSLDKRCFLMNNVHDQAPLIFQTRWALSYLRGPLTRNQIQQLSRPAQPAPAPSSAPLAAAEPAAEAPSVVADAFAARSAPPPRTTPIPVPGVSAPAPGIPATASDTAAEPAALSAAPPPLPPDITQVFLRPDRPLALDAALIYRPALIGVIRAHYERRSAGIDEHYETVLLAGLPADPATDPWPTAEHLEGRAAPLDPAPDPRARFAPLPAIAGREASHRAWRKGLESYVFRELTGVVWSCRELKQFSRLDEPEAEFRARLRHVLRESRDAQVDKLRQKYAPKFAVLEDRLRRAEQRIDAEKAQASQAGLSTAVSVGSSILGALFGRRRSPLTGAGAAVRSAGRTAKERADIARAQEDRAAVIQKKLDLERDFEAEARELQAIGEVEPSAVEQILIRPKKSGIEILRFGLAWRPI